MEGGRTRTGKGAAPPPEILRDGMNGRDCKLWICLLRFGLGWVEFCESSDRWFTLVPLWPCPEAEQGIPKSTTTNLGLPAVVGGESDNPCVSHRPWLCLQSVFYYYIY